MDELRALFFGATVAAAIGPIALLIIHNGMRHRLAAGPPAERAPARRIGFRGTFLLTLANPLTIALFTAFSGQLALSARWSGALYFAAFIFAGSLPEQAG